MKKCSSGDILHITNKPNQPNAKSIPVQTLSNRVLHFQERWYKEYPWLHYSPTVKGILCFHCVKIYTIQKSTMSKKADPAFCSKGFTNWKNALERFERHQNTKSHHHAVTVSCQEAVPINTQLSTAWSKQQENARHCLQIIVGAVQYLTRQGLALRGHDKDDGNLFQYLKYKAKDDACLSDWLCHCHDYTSPQVQNEILQMLGNSIVRNIAQTIQSLSVLQFSIIIDGTQDISGAEQESICLRYVDEDLVPHEVFIGLYEVSGTTGVEIAKMAVDVLLRLNIPMTCLRGQTYDGAANMSGAYSGAQVVLKKYQPLALYVHCGTHCLNLITQAACQASPLIRDALEWVHDLGSLSKQSGKFKAMFAAVAADSDVPSASLRPLCPTRWTVRGTAIKAVLSHYESVLTSLEEMAATGSSTGARANGLRERFEKGKTVLGLLLALELIEELECLNKSLQKRIATIAGMQQSIECVKSTLQFKRNEERFQEIFKNAVKMVDSLGIEPIQMPHQRQTSRRYTGGASQHTHKSPEEYYRAEFYKLLDCVDVQFQERFNQPDLGVLNRLEDILLTGELDDIVDQYPELNRETLKVQLAMFKSKYNFKSSTEVATIMRGMPVEVRGLFDQIETLVRLLLVIPVSSAEAERSFSTLRRLKTWLRSTMTQMRLNNAAVCHVHQNSLDNIDVKQICQQLISVFGSFI
uniref:TTF-type domain-containing protein n=1 Tax=Paramormyrops kingsleyae TaxID=1676925 RepID=A0A3B3QRQ9_9TELE